MRIRKNHIMLLEILIAFALVVLALLPLIYPHVFILKSEKKFVQQVELDHAVNLLYAQIVQDLYENKIPWETLQSKTPIPVEFKDLPYKGEYVFGIVNFKPKKDPPAPYSLYLYSLDFTFNDSHKYHYEIFVVRDLGEGAPKEEEEEEKSDED